MTNRDRQARREGKIGAKIEQFRKDNEYRNYRSSKYQSFTNGLGLIFGVLLLVILVVNVFKYANGGSQVTFSGFLSFLSNFDVGFELPNLDYFQKIFTMSKEWSILDGLRIFLNGLGNVLSVVAYLGANVVYTITFLSKLIIFLLG